jgi:4-amino-4-deoxy-L-arabinose transferase-like glycosyltransferase
VKKPLSIGFIIVGIVTTILWAATAILHFFYFAPSYPPGEWFRAFIELLNWLALNPFVFGATAVLALCLIAYSLLHRTLRESVTARIPINLIAILLVVCVTWMVLGLIIPILFGGIELKLIPRHGLKVLSLYAYTGGDMASTRLAKETRWFLPLFDILLHLAVINYLLAFAFFIISSVFGRALIKRIWPDLEFPSRLQEFIFSTATGLGAISILLLFIGLLHILYAWVVALLLFTALFFGIESVPNYLKTMWNGVKSVRLPGLTAGIFIVLLLIIISSLHAPLFPVFMHDAMNSHLEGPKVFIREHAIGFHAYINFNNFPLGIDLLYIPMLMIKRLPMTQLVTFFFFLMCLGIVYEFGRVYLKSPLIGMLSAVLLCLIPRFVGQFNHPTIDVGLTFYIILFALAVAGWLYAGNEKYLHLSGLILGLGLGVKYTALPFLLIFVAWILIQRLLLENKPVRQTLSKTGLMLIIAVIVCSPWYIRNIVLFGNPFFPFYDDFFETILPIGTAKELKPFLEIDEKDMLAKFQYEGDWERGYQFLPDLSITSEAGAMHNQMGPIYLAILPMLILVLLSGLGKLLGKYVLGWEYQIDYHIPVWMLLAASLLYCAYWVFYVGVLHTRYLFPIMPFFALIAGFTLNYIFRLDKVNPRHALTLLFLAGFGMLAVAYFNRGVLSSPVNGLPIQGLSRQAFLEMQISSYAAVKEANETLGPRDIVYGLYCENCRYYANFTIIGGLFGYADHKGFNRHTHTGRELYDYLKDFGCSYLLVDTKRQQMLSESYAAIKLPTDPTFKMHFKHISQQGATNLYQIID